MKNFLKKYIDLEGMSQTKADTLLHYCGQEPKIFIQYDGFTNVEPDAVMRPDADKDSIWRVGTIELMQGSSVRVLIEPDTPEEVILRVLQKITK